MAHSLGLRPDFEQLRSINNETRSAERLWAHFQLEAELAGKLRHSRREERDAIYGQLYSELFDRLPDHPQHRRDAAYRRRNTAKQIEFLRPYLTPGTVYVEVGCGDAAVTQGVSALVLKAIGIDVTSMLIDWEHVPANFRFLETNGTEIDLPAACVDLVYSNQLMEHLHPDDAQQQLQEIWRILKPGGRYICSTPNRLTGPHDISVYFQYEPGGFHMREYDHGMLAAMFREVGFRLIKAHASLKGWRIHLPVAVARLGEYLFSTMPHALRTRLMKVTPLRNLAGIVLIGRK